MVCVSTEIKTGSGVGGILALVNNDEHPLKKLVVSLLKLTLCGTSSSVECDDRLKDLCNQRKIIQYVIILFNEKRLDLTDDELSDSNDA